MNETSEEEIVGTMLGEYDGDEADIRADAADVIAPRAAIRRRSTITTTTTRTKDISLADNKRGAVAQCDRTSSCLTKKW